MKPKSVLIILITLYAVSFVYLLNRSLDLHFNGELIALLPSDNNHLESYKKLSQLNSSEGGFDLVIGSISGETIIKKAEEITSQMLELKLDGENIFRSAELENDLYDIKNSALYLMTESELDQLYTEVEEYIDNKKMEANPYYVELEGTADELDMGTNSSVLLDEIARAKRYSINSDSTVINVRFLVAFPKSDFNKLEKAYGLLLTQKANMEAQYGTVEMFWGGSYVSHFNKINDIQYSVTKALVIGVLSLVLFLIGYMLFINRNSGYKPRFIVADIALVFFVLFSGFIISLGLSTFLFNEINVFTGIIFSILFGINLDYILHLYSVNKKNVLAGSSVYAIAKSYLSSTKPILLSCLTTGLAIMSLVFADFEGFIQFGIIFFINIIVNLGSTYLFLLLSPSLEKRNEESEKGNVVFLKLTEVASVPKNQRIGGIFFFSFLILVGAFLGIGSLSFNFSFSDLEPESATTDFKKLSSTVNTGKRYHDPSYFIAEDIQESKKLFEHLKERIGNEYPDIERVESFSARYPVSEEQKVAKAIKVTAIQQLINNNEEFLGNVSEQASEFIEIARNTVPPTLEGLPKYIKNRFFFDDGSIAPLVIMYPAMSLSNGATSIKFRKSSGAITVESGKVFYAASTYMIASSILELLISESTFLFVTPLLTIIVLLLIYYRSLTKALIAILPLLITFGLLLSIRSVFEFDINLYNVIVFPIIIGVGADNGIHLVDSLITKKDRFFNYFISQKFPVLAACSVTTILGFVGLLFINYPGMESIGILAITGITVTLMATFFTSVLVRTLVQKK